MNTVRKGDHYLSIPPPGSPTSRNRQLFHRAMTSSTARSRSQLQPTQWGLPQLEPLTTRATGFRTRRSFRRRHRSEPFDQIYGSKPIIRHPLASLPGRIPHSNGYAFSFWLKLTRFHTNFLRKNIDSLHTGFSSTHIEWHSIPDPAVIIVGKAPEAQSERTNAYGHPRCGLSDQMGNNWES